MLLINKFILWMLPIFPRKLIWLFSKKYVAGVKLDDAINCSIKLNAEGMKVTIDILGEAISSLNEAESYRDQYLDVIEKVEAKKIDGNYSLKPTMFGLGIDKDKCYESIRTIVEKAASFNNFVRIDMENSPYTDLEIDLYKKLLKEFPDNVGLVLQSYLKRTNKDIIKIHELTKENLPVNFRLCKGIYNESSEIAYKKYEDINDRFINDLDLILEKKIYVGIATHDKNLIHPAYDLIKKHNCNKSDYEFQMLLGITPDLRKSIINEGHSMRIYVPFGKDWFEYSYRRFKENPKMVTHIIKALFIKG